MDIAYVLANAREENVYAHKWYVEHEKDILKVRKIHPVKMTLKDGTNVFFLTESTVIKWKRGREVKIVRPEWDG